MKRILKTFLAATALLAAAAAAQVPDPYQATVKLENQSAAARDKALREALSGVLARVSGQANLAAAGRTAPILARANALIRSLSYSSDENGAALLVASFDPQAVDSALRQQGLPVHGIASGSVEELSVSVSGIGSPQDYARALNHLRGLPGIKGLQVAGASGDTLNLTLRAEGGAARLAGAVSVGGVLRRVGSDGLDFALKR